MSERNPDDEYFAQLEREKKAKLKQKMEAERAETDREALRQLHFHRCGKCGEAMATKTFRGTEIEVCPNCGAVLLDRGELEDLAGTDRSGVLSGLLDLFGGKGS